MSEDFIKSNFDFDNIDPVIAHYMKDVDRTLLRANLKLSVEQRLRNLETLNREMGEIREAGRKAKPR